MAQYAALSSEGYDDLLDEDNTEDAYVLRQSLKGMGERLVNVINTGLPDPALDLQTQVTYQMLCAMNHPTQYKMSEPERKHLAAAQLMLSIIKPQEAENAPNIRRESYKQSLRKPLLMTMSAHFLSKNQAVDDGKMTPFHEVMLDFHAIMKSSSKNLADPSNRWWIEISTPCGRFTSYHASKKLFYAINALNTKEGQVNGASELNQLITYYRNWSNLPQIKRAVVSSLWLGKTIRRKLTDLRNILEGESTYKKKSSGFGVMDIREAKMFLKIFPDLLNKIRPDQGQVEQHLQYFDEEQNRRMHPKTSEQTQNLMKALLPSQLEMVNLCMQLRMQEVRENNRLDEAIQEVMQNNVQPLEETLEEKNQELEQLRRQLAQTANGNRGRNPGLFQENAPARREGVVNIGDVQVEHADAALVRN